LGAYSQGLAQISRAVVDKAGREVFGPPEKPMAPSTLAAAPAHKAGVFSAWFTRQPVLGATLLVALGAGLTWVGSKSDLVALMGQYAGLSTADGAALRLKHSARISIQAGDADGAKAASPSPKAASAPDSKP
jgi:hypothetical protein